jgi:hypothetical protein
VYPELDALFRNFAAVTSSRTKESSESFGPMSHVKPDPARIPTTDAHKRLAELRVDLLDYMAQKYAAEAVDPEK